MKRDTALEILRSHRQQLAARGVAALYLYGSVARDEADDDSDVDLLMVPAHSQFSLYDMIDVMDVCAGILHSRVDLNDHRGLARAPAFHRRIAADLVHVF